MGEIANISEDAESNLNSGLKIKFPEVKLPVKVREKLSASPSETNAPKPSVSEKNSPRNPIAKLSLADNCGYRATPANPVSPAKVAVVALIPKKKLSDKSNPPV